MRRGEVCIFESLRVIIDGRRVKITSRNERTLFARLAMNAGKRVTHDDLCQALWGEGYSQHEHDSKYRSLVSRLRATLGDKDGSLIATEPGGYRLALNPEDIDNLAFAGLLKAGHAAGDWVSALDDFTRAAELRTGDPFFCAESRYLRDMYCKALDKELTRFRARRAEAVIRVASPESAAGVLDELESLIRKNRDNEGLRWLRMLALYRSGSRAAALEYYRKTRDYLVSKHGSDPGEKLRVLQQLMLREDPRLLETPLRDSTWAMPAPVSRVMSP